MSEVQTFVERCLAGTAVPGEIDDYVDLWHDIAVVKEVPLHVFLGMDEHEYALWMRNPDAIHGIIQVHKGRVRQPT
jgi:hypothetical protein